MEGEEEGGNTAKHETAATRTFNLSPFPVCHRLLFVSPAGNEAEVEGTLSVQPQANPVGGFDDYFLSLTVEKNKRNPWFVGKRERERERERE